MILTDLENKVVREYDDHGRIYPRYDGFGLSSIPNYVLRSFSVNAKGPSLDQELLGNVEFRKYSRIVVFYIDGVGYDYLKNSHGNKGFFGKVSEKGMLAPITTVFPSTTASASATLSTGLTPMEHLLIEWQLYFHETGALMYTLPFKPVTSAYEKRAAKLNPWDLFYGNPIYSKLSEHGVKSYVFVNKAISHGDYSDLVFRGSQVIQHSFLTDCMVNLRKTLENDGSEFYAYVYVETADSAGHDFGPSSEKYSAEINNISRIIYEELVKKIDPEAAKDVLLIFTSDHGQVDIDPDRTIYLNNLPGIEESYEMYDNLIIPPTGSPRDVFLHIRKELVDETIARLGDFLGAKADAIRTDEAVKAGLFGKDGPSQKLFRRIGSALILPRSNETVWHRLRGMHELDLLGMHGGLNREEMLVPLGSAPMKDLLQ